MTGHHSWEKLMKDRDTPVVHVHLRLGTVTMLAGVCIFVVMSVASPAFSQQHECAHLPTTYEATYEEHKQLYEHALIAGFPDATQNACSAVDIAQPIIQRFVSVTESEVDVDGVLRIGALRELVRPDNVDIYRDRNSHAYISCKKDDGNSLARIFVNVSWDRESVFRFHVLVEANHFRRYFDEEMNFHTLHSTDGHEIHTFDPQIVVIENTDSFGEFVTGVAEIARDSCAFDFMASFVGYLTRSRERESLTVVGHSLGGAATQHVTQHPPSNAGNVRGYSFSSFGLDSGGKTPTGEVFSYYIKGDPFVERFSDRDQVGTVIRYNPPFWYGLHSGYLSRHFLESVQDAICKCIEAGRGSLTVEVPPGP